MRKKPQNIILNMRKKPQNATILNKEGKQNTVPSTQRSPNLKKSIS